MVYCFLRLLIGLLVKYYVLLEDVYLQCTTAIMGYGPEDNNAVIELTYNYGVSEYDKGNGYGQVKLH